MTREELTELFIQTATNVETVVEIIEKNSTALSETLKKITGETEDVLLATPEVLDSELFSEFITGKNVLTNPTDYQIANSKFSITDAFAGIAKTGSICISINKNMGSTFSLFTKVHIAVLDIYDLLYRPRDVFLKEPYRAKTFIDDFLFISGSSATADMGPLVRGVHAPAKLYVIILKGEND